MKKNKNMRTAIIIVCTVLFAAFLAVQISPTPIKYSSTLSSHSDSPQKLIAHRGFSSKCPENTLPAIEAAIESGFYGCEFDIHATKDGVWILNHDTSIDKMTDGSGEIKDMTYDEILQFTVDKGKGIKKYPGLKLPKLADAFELISNSQIVPFIEIKGYDPVAFAALLELIDNYGLSDRAVIISFDMEALLGIRELSSTAKLMFVTNNLTTDDVDTCIANGNIGVDINGGLIFKMADEVRYAQENGLEVAAWTVDLPLHADILNLYDIKYITTNRIY